MVVPKHGTHNPWLYPRAFACAVAAASTCYIYTPVPYSSCAGPDLTDFSVMHFYSASFLQSAYLTMNDISFYVIVNDILEPLRAGIYLPYLLFSSI